MGTHTKLAPPSESSTVAVLVVDDGEVLRNPLYYLILTKGYPVFTAPDGMSALDRLRSHPAPMVVLLDWHMPNMDGVRVLQALAADESAVRPHNFTVLTAANHELRQQLSRDIAALPAHLSVMVLGKPLDLDVLLTVASRAAEHVADDT
jgi:CheY-like chemotaxis protein